MPSQLRVRFTSQSIVLDITIVHANDQANATLVRDISLGLVVQAISAIVLAHGTAAGAHCMLYWKTDSQAQCKPIIKDTCDDKKHGNDEQQQRRTTIRTSQNNHPRPVGTYNTVNSPAVNALPVNELELGTCPGRVITLSFTTSATATCGDWTRFATCCVARFR